MKLMLCAITICSLSCHAAQQSASKQPADVSNGAGSHTKNQDLVSLLRVLRQEEATRRQATPFPRPPEHQCFRSTEQTPPDGKRDQDDKRNSDSKRNNGEQ